jgi:hypothetical protein
MEPKKETNEEFLLKEVEIVQEAIRRMASNSFVVKGVGYNSCSCDSIVKSGFVSGVY